MLVDIRPAAQRAAEGEIPGALIVERNVLEWRFDPASDARLPQAGYDLQVIVVCSEGYTSSLAAAALQDLGVRHATDLDGGFRAWKAAGLPSSSAGPSTTAEPRPARRGQSRESWTGSALAAAVRAGRPRCGPVVRGWMRRACAGVAAPTRSGGPAP